MNDRVEPYLGYIKGSLFSTGILAGVVGFILQRYLSNQPGACKTDPNCEESKVMGGSNVF